MIRCFRDNEATQWNELTPMTVLLTLAHTHLTNDPKRPWTALVMHDKRLLRFELGKPSDYRIVISVCKAAVSNLSDLQINILESEYPDFLSFIKN